MCPSERNVKVGSSVSKRLKSVNVHTVSAQLTIMRKCSTFFYTKRQRTLRYFLNHSFNH